MEFLTRGFANPIKLIDLALDPAIKKAYNAGYV
jgi:hypothetical protein